MKIESPFIKAALIVLSEGDYENKMTHARFEGLKNIIAMGIKSFYLLGKRGLDISSCKEFLADFDEGATLDELLEKASGEEEKEND